jgi:hypothetical protein
VASVMMKGLFEAVMNFRKALMVMSLFPLKFPGIYDDIHIGQRKIFNTSNHRERTKGVPHGGKSRNHDSRILAGDDGGQDMEHWEAHPISEGVTIFPCMKAEDGCVFQ